MFAVILSTAPSAEVAAEIAKALVEARAAACVNIVPGVRSIYRWEEKIQDEAEVLMVIKTTRDRQAAAAELIKSLHPYDLPEIVLIDATASPEYLQWVRMGVIP